MPIQFVSNIAMLFFIRNKTKNMDVTAITEALYEAESAQEKANNDLEDATNITDMIKDQITDVTPSLPLYILPSIIHHPPLSPSIHHHPSITHHHPFDHHPPLDPPTHPSIHTLYAYVRIDVDLCRSPPGAAEAGWRGEGDDDQPATGGAAEGRRCSEEQDGHEQRAGARGQGGSRQSDGRGRRRWGCRRHGTHTHTHTQSLTDTHTHTHTHTLTHSLTHSLTHYSTTAGHF